MKGKLLRCPVPFGLLGMLALVILIESALSIGGKFTNDSAETWRIKQSQTGREALTSDVLFFGDSLVEYGLVPKVFEERLNRRSFNLAVPAGTPETSYFLLRQAIDSGARPSRVVVNFMPFQLAPPPYLDEIRIRLWPELAGMRDVFDLAWSKRKPDVATTIWMAQILTSYRARTEIRASIVAALQGRSMVGDETRVFVTRWNLRSNRGALVVPDMMRVADTFGRHLPQLETTERQPRAVAFVTRFLQLAVTHGITVYWLIPPISPEYQAGCDEVGSTDDYSRFVRFVQSKYPNVVAIDARHAGYTPDLFADGMHLTRRGATALSESVAAVMERPVGSDRLVNLPRYRERPASPAIEDILESRIAIGLVPSPGVRR